MATRIKFNKQCLTDYKWLKYDGDKMFCTVCVEAQMSNAFTKGSGDFQK